MPSKNRNFAKECLTNAGINPNKYPGLVARLNRDMNDAIKSCKNDETEEKNLRATYGPAIKNGVTFEQAAKIVGDQYIIHPDQVVEVFGLEPLHPAIRDLYLNLALPRNLLEELVKPIHSPLFPEVLLDPQPPLYLIPLLPVYLDESFPEMIKQKGLVLQNFNDTWVGKVGFSDKYPAINRRGIIEDPGEHPRWLFVRTIVAPLDTNKLSRHAYNGWLEQRMFLYTAILVRLCLNQLLCTQSTSSYSNSVPDNAILTTPSKFFLSDSPSYDLRKHSNPQPIYGSIFHWVNFE